jgi:hypothetical protein
LDVAAEASATCAASALRTSANVASSFATRSARLRWTRRGERAIDGRLREMYDDELLEGACCKRPRGF